MIDGCLLQPVSPQNQTPANNTVLQKSSEIHVMNPNGLNKILQRCAFQISI